MRYRKLYYNDVACLDDTGMKGVGGIFSNTRGKGYVYRGKTKSYISETWWCTPASF